jgi:hypothetical protein
MCYGKDAIRALASLISARVDKTGSIHSILHVEGAEVEDKDKILSTG